MCLEDLRIARHKYTSQAFVSTDGNQTRRAGSRTTLFGPLTDHGEVTLLVGGNEKRTALRVCVAPELIFNDETDTWTFLETVVIGFPVPQGTQSVFDVQGPLNVLFAFNQGGPCSDILTIEDIGTLIYEPFGFIAFAVTAELATQIISVTDISADADVMAAAQNDDFLRGQ